MSFTALEGRRVAVWGLGREGRAALTALRRALPGQPLTLFCGESEAAAARALDAAPLDIVTGAPDAGVLSAFDVVVKSPGISAYRPEILVASERGTRFTSGTALWFDAHPDARVIAVTGTKGKSTTSAMLAHLARALGVRTALAGNIGLPLLDVPTELAPELWVLELSSFQTRDAGAVDLAVVTSLYEEHLDWHGSAERYVADKLALARQARQLLVNGGQARLLEATAAHPHRHLFGRDGGWHVSDGAICRGSERLMACARLLVPGAHNALNACAALQALELVGLDARAAVTALESFQPLPHRLQRLGQANGLHWINDSIATNPGATLAALRSMPDVPVTLIVGGFDRGVEWSEFAAKVKARPPHAIVGQGANGPGIVAALRAADVTCELAIAEGLADAVALARSLTPRGGTVLLAPGAPSFDQFRDFTERGRRFAELAGFEGGVQGIEGLGVV